MLLPTLISICLVFGKVESQSFEESVEVTIRWKEQFLGWIEIKVLEDVTDGWTIKVNFSQPVRHLNVLDTEVIAVNDNYTEYILGNRPYNAELPAGTELRMLMIGNMKKDISFESDCEVRKAVPPILRYEMPESMMSAPPYDYGEAMRLSILFYEIQRSGDIPLIRNISWRQCSALDDKSTDGKDLSGGYYDAGDYLKFSLTIAYAASILSWGYITYPDVYKDKGLDKDILTAIKWGTDYLIKCHTDEDEFVYQVGNPGADHAYWGRPEDMTMARPAYTITKQLGKRGSEPTALTAAALASATIALREEYPCADRMLSHARQLYALANNYRAIYEDNGYYGSNGFGDELCYAAVWLYMATGEEQYLQDAKDHYVEFNLQGRPYSFSWADVRSGCQLLLYSITKDSKYYESFVSFLDAWLPGGEMPYTDNGLVFRDMWGSLRYAAGASWLALAAAEEGVRPAAYRRFAQSQIHYILGESGRSFLIGFGENYPTHPHHRSSSCPEPPASCGWGNAFVSPTPNPHTCYGALVGGPRDLHDLYTDKRANYYENEVAIDYNAGLVAALAGMASLI